jgi:hypothetical protein
MGDLVENGILITGEERYSRHVRSSETCRLRHEETECYFVAEICVLELKVGPADLRCMDRLTVLP